MHFGLPGTINSSVSSQGITVMATSPKKTTDKAQDDAWNEIFESLSIENEPPVRYIKNVVIQTKDGSVIKVSGKHFAEIIEQERELSPDQSEIQSCRLSINFPRLRADVDAWAHGLFDMLDSADQFKSTVKAKRSSRRVTKKPKVD